MYKPVIYNEEKLLSKEILSFIYEKETITGVKYLLQYIIHREHLPIKIIKMI